MCLATGCTADGGMDGHEKTADKRGKLDYLDGELISFFPSSRLSNLSFFADFHAQDPLLDSISFLKLVLSPIFSTQSFVDVVHTRRIPYIYIWKLSQISKMSQS